MRKKGVKKVSPAEKAPKPIEFKKLSRRIKRRKAIASSPRQPVELNLVVASAREVKVRFDATRLEGRRVVPGGGKAHKVTLSIEGATLGRHAFPPIARVKKFAATRKLEPANDKVLAGYLPDHLALRPTPERLAKELKIPRRIDASRYKLSKGKNQATTIFAPDDRYTFSDTSFPWCTAGRVDTANGTGSGVMIGPRHLLTVSHIIVWNNDNTAGWVKFTPSFFDGSAPFGVAWGQWVYFEVKVVGPGVDHEEGRHDYVVVVLDQPMGNTTGWMGSRTYSNDWDGGTYWSHIGYPADLASANRPSFQGSISLNGAAESDPTEHKNIEHKADVWPGQSGGPVFGWWDNEPWPRAVSVQSWQNTGVNGASGGAHMVDLIIRARNDFP
jgi:V8-like Glu-specific endopeptidase